jgi:hypothetical protein
VGNADVRQSMSLVGSCLSNEGEALLEIPRVCRSAADHCSRSQLQLRQGPAQIGRNCCEWDCAPLIIVSGVVIVITVAGVAKDGITTAISEPAPKAVAEPSAIKATGKRIIKDDPASRGIAAIVSIFLIAFLLFNATPRRNSKRIYRRLGASLFYSRAPRIVKAQWSARCNARLSDQKR